MLTQTANALAGLEPQALFRPIADREKIGLAISGGPDSLALLLLYVAWRLCGSAPDAVVYTLDHGLRPEAATEAEAVRAIAAAYGVSARVLRWEGEKPKSGIQAAARAARYRLIGEAMRADGAEVLLTAHHQGDQAETVLMRLAHGSGVRGLGAMRRFTRIEGTAVFRPLLDVSKDQLRAIVSGHGLEAFEDPSNANSNFERVRWRMMAQSLADLGLTDTRLARFATRMQRLDALATQAADAFCRDHMRRDRFGVIHIGRTALVEAAEETVIRVLERAVQHVSGGQQPDLSAIETLAGRIADGSLDSSVTLSGAVIDPGPERILVYREAGREGLPTRTLSGGEKAVWDDRFVISTDVSCTVAPASAMTREKVEALIGWGLDVPMSAVRAAPLVTAIDGRLLALGCFDFAPNIAISHVALT